MASNVTIDDIVSARIWAETNCGDDNPMDVYEDKLLEIASKSHQSSSIYHERMTTKCETMRAEIASRFKVEPEF